MKVLALWRYTLPLRVPLAMKYGVLHQREGLLLETDGADSSRWCEIAPFPGLNSESLTDCHDWLCAAKKNLLATPAPWPSLSWGLAASRQAAPADVPVPLNALLTAPVPERIGQEAADFYQQGYRCFKLKVGQARLVDDQARIAALLAATGSDIRLRLDANRSWTLSEALTMAHFLADKPLDYLEEPLRHPLEIPALYQATGCPIALDESLSAWTPSQLCWEALSAVVLKPMLLGAPAVFRWAEAARERGKSVTISSVFESGLGVLYLARLAQCLAPDTPAGLDTWRAFTQDVLIPPLQTEGGYLLHPAKSLDNSLLQTVNLVKIPC
jgi:O-succinylbenzoate synthase